MDDAERANALLLIARWQRGELPPEDVPSLAVEALERGCGSGALAVLAGISGESRRSIEDVLPPVLAELGLQRPSEDEAFKIVADDILGQVAAGDVEPVRGARRLWAMSSERGDFAEPIWSQVQPFVGLASQWEDDPERRAPYERDIVEEATALVARGGLRLQE